MKTFSINPLSGERIRNIEILFFERKCFKKLNDRQYKKAIKNCMVVKVKKGGKWDYVDLSLKEVKKCRSLKNA